MSQLTEPPAQDDVSVVRTPRRRGSARRTIIVWLGRVAVVAIVLAAWQWIPEIKWVSSRYHFMQPIIISSPARVVGAIRDLLFGTNATATIWPYLGTTLIATLEGTVIGVLLGGIVGLLLSSSEVTNRIFRPFINFANAVPRIALVPIVVVLVGPTPAASVVTAVLLVFFLVVFNVYAGSQSVRSEILQNVTIMNASPWQVIRDVRFPFAAVWAFAAVPNAISFGLVGVVTSEILDGVHGVGFYLLNATSSVNSSQTFAIAIILGVIGLVLVSLTDVAGKRILHWQ